MGKKLTIVIPARHEIYLQETVSDILRKAVGDIEVIVVLDGYWPDVPLKDNPRLRVIHWERKGMRACINAAAQAGSGDYFMKVDAHIAFDEGFDEKLKEDCDGDWVVVPRRFSLEPDDWSIRQNRRAVDYEYQNFPEYDNHGIIGFHARAWPGRSKERSDPKYDIDEQMAYQGSCWFIPMPYFKKLIYPMDEATYGTFVGEGQEVGLKVWLSGGKVMLNKKTWYAHLWKGQGYRDLFLKMYGQKYTRIGYHERKFGNEASTNYWIRNCWPERKHDLSWLVERFWPVPSWPEDRSLWTSYPALKRNTIST